MYVNKNTYHKRSHTRVQVYTVTRHKDFDNFLMNPDFIHEDKIRFVYNDESGHSVEKVIPMADIVHHVKSFPIYKDNEFTLRKEYKGWVYKVESDFVTNYY